MSKVVDAIHELGGGSQKIKSSSLQIIRDNREEATNFFLDSLDRMIEDPSLNDGRLIDDSFFGLFFLAEWKETSSFKKMQRILHLIGENTDGWLADALTENLPAISF